MYAREPAEFLVARRAYVQLTEELGVERDLGSLGTPESRNIVRHVALRTGREAVLKVAGHTREPGEGEALAAWYRAGLPCVRPIEWGYRRVSASDGAATASFVVTELVGTARPPTPSIDGRGTRIARALRLADFIAPFHAADVRLPLSRDWAARSAEHLCWTLPVIRATGLPEPPDWSRKLRWASDLGTTTIHGDPAGSNVLDSPNGLVAIDPPGAVRAPREADLARICVQADDASDVVSVMEAVWAEHRHLNFDLLAFFVGMELFVVAGYLLADHLNPDATRVAAGGTPSRNEHATRTLATATDLIGELRLPPNP